MAQVRTISIAERARATAVQWNESLDAVLTRMDAAADNEALVLQGDQPVGRIRRVDLERLQRRGNAACSIAAKDAMERLVVAAGGG
jgi:hypothetical protein